MTSLELGKIQLLGLVLSVEMLPEGAWDSCSEVRLYTKICGPFNRSWHRQTRLRIIHAMVTKLQRSDSIDRITELLGPNASELLDHSSQTISKDQLQLPGPDFVDRVWSISDRSR